MVQDLGFGIDVKVMPTVRDADGLALSSRNAYLSPDERQLALAIPRALEQARRLFQGGERSRDVLMAAMRQCVQTAGPLAIDYIELVHPDSLEAADPITADTMALIAAKVGKTRLIDNTRLGV